MGNNILCRGQPLHSRIIVCTKKKSIECAASVCEYVRVFEWDPTALSA